MIWPLLVALCLAGPPPEEVAPGPASADPQEEAEDTAVPGEPVEEAVASPPAPEPTGAVAEPPDHSTLVWQGFDHTWLRRLAFGFVVPHRVSLFRSRPVDEHHELVEGGVRTKARWQFGQSTGVDGDFMEPEAYAARITAPDVAMLRGRLRFNTVDRIGGVKAPRALARFHDVLRVPATTRVGEGHAVALVRGISFRSACMDQEDQCNSDGIWPYRFRVELAPCHRVEDEWACPVMVEVGRAWTPARGGVKYIEQKPLNEQMAIEVQLDWVALEGPEESLTSSTFTFENALDSNKKIQSEEQTQPVPVVGGGAYPTAFAGFSSFAFQFFPRGGRRSLGNRGRYVAGWSMRIREKTYDAEEGVFVLGHSGGIWLPRTVKETGVSLELGLTVTQLGHPDATVRPVDDLKGRLCSDSHGAPFFSKWTRCADLSGSEQVEHEVPFVVE